MKNIAILIFGLLLNQLIFSQTDKNGNPIFNNQLISEEKLENFELTSSYYNIIENITNKKSSVFVSENPSLEDYLKFSKDLPATFFIVHKGQNVYFMIMALQKMENDKLSLFYNVVNPNNMKSVQIPSLVKGEISEKRANELIELNIDKNSKINFIDKNESELIFDGKTYKIQKYLDVKNEVIELANQIINQDSKKNETETKPIENIEEYIRKETINGELNFTKVANENKSPFILYEQVMYNKKDFAILLWGKKVQTLGIEKSKKAIKLWEEINSRKLTKPEKKALLKGFEIKE